MTSKGVHHVELSKKSSIRQRDLYNCAMVSAGSVKLLVKNLNRFLVFTSR